MGCVRSHRFSIRQSARFVEQMFERASIFAVTANQKPSALLRRFARHAQNRSKARSLVHSLAQTVPIAPFTSTRASPHIAVAGSFARSFMTLSTGGRFICVILWRAGSA